MLSRLELNRLKLDANKENHRNTESARTANYTLLYFRLTLINIKKIYA